MSYSRFEPYIAGPAAGALSGLNLGLIYNLAKQFIGASRFQKAVGEQEGVTHPMPDTSSIKYDKVNTVKEFTDWHKKHPGENELDKVYSMMILKNKNNAAIYIPTGDNRPYLYIGGESVPDAMRAHELGHLKDFVEKGIVTRKDFVKYYGGHPVKDTLKAIVKGPKHTPVYKAEVAAWEQSGIPEDNILRTRALKTYENDRSMPRHAVGGAVLGAIGGSLIDLAFRKRR